MGLLATLLGSRLPERYQKYFNLPESDASYKLAETGDTTLGRAASRWAERSSGSNGVLRLDLGSDALGVRIGMIERAERSVDIQSYLIKNDLSGNLVALKLAEAADRGVRIRLLMDDALTHSIDTGLLSLDDHPNIEVRVFNPFPRRRSRFVSFVANFNVLNRRMHNKTFTADNQLSIVGGRNLADEYFRTDGVEEFIDEDLLLIGPVVDQISDGFDEYWNSPDAFPMGALNRLVTHKSIADMAAEAQAFLEENARAHILRDSSERILREHLDDRADFLAAPVELVIDRPDKIRVRLNRPTSRTLAFLRSMVESTKDNVLIVSPYFVPQKNGVEFLSRLAKRGAEVTVVTNSLASTNHSSVHAAYARYRKPLLRAGVQLYELKPGVDTQDPESKLTLHSKVALVDGERVFVGSFNLDPRSLYLNTEMGVAVTSADLTKQFAESIDEQLRSQAYKLFLSDTGRLMWRHAEGNVEKVASVEPHTSVGRRLSTWLMSLLPMEGQM